jgi:hypothetical protein
VFFSSTKVGGIGASVVLKIKSLPFIPKADLSKEMIINLFGNFRVL